ALKSEGEKDRQRACDRAYDNCFDKDYEIVNARVAPDAAINAHYKKGRHLYEEQHGQRAQKDSQRSGLPHRTEAQNVSSVVGENYQHKVQEDFKDSALVGEIN